MPIMLRVEANSDEEIRAYIKGLIKGQVASLTRDEILAKVVESATEHKLEKALDVVRDNAEQMYGVRLKAALNKTYDLLSIRSDAQKMIKEIVNNYVTEGTIQSMLRTILEEKIRKMGI